MESLLTERLVAFVVRTRRPLLRSRPSGLLLVSTVPLVVLALGMPYMPLARVMGFVPLSGAVMVSICVIAGLYVVAAEMVKRWFFRPPVQPSAVRLESA